MLPMLPMIAVDTIISCLPFHQQARIADRYKNKIIPKMVSKIARMYKGRKQHFHEVQSLELPCRPMKLKAIYIITYPKDCRFLYVSHALKYMNRMMIIHHIKSLTEANKILIINENRMVLDYVNIDIIFKEIILLLTPCELMALGW